MAEMLQLKREFNLSKELILLRQTTVETDLINGLINKETNSIVT